MSSLFANTNLRPGERRLVVLTATVVFVVINILFVWPHFGDWKRVQDKQYKAKATLRNYQNKIHRIPEYQAKLQELEAAGSSVVAEGQELELASIVTEHSRLHGISLNRSEVPRVSQTQTNQFFEERLLSINVEADDDNLVDFMLSLASTNSLIRVKNLDLRPNHTGTRLIGNIIFVASYQKKAPSVPLNANPIAGRTPAASPTNRLALKTAPAIPAPK